MNLTLRKYGIGIILCGIVAIAAGLFATRSQGPAFGQFGDVASIASGFGSITERFSEAIVTYGPESAHAAFVDSASRLGYPEQHLLAHAFGESLYRTEGLSSFIVCDARFGFGCQHGFAGKALEERGMEAVKELDRICVETYGERGTGCSHGIGHALLSHLGDSGLEEALRTCQGLTWQGPIAGCSSGVFMEYNFHTMDIGAGLTTRAFTEARRHAPCADGISLYRASCYFEQPAWWRSSLEQRGASIEQTYRDMGAWCAEVEEADLKDACLRGIGNVIPANAQFDVAASVERCNLMPDTASSLVCRKGAAWGFFAEPTRREQAAYMCSLGADEKEQERCASDYQLI